MMKNISSLDAPISQLKESLSSMKNSVKKIPPMAEETFSKWRIGRRNFP